MKLRNNEKRSLENAAFGLGLAAVLFALIYGYKALRLLFPELPSLD